MADFTSPAELHFGHFEVQPAQRQLLVEGQPARLGARAFDVLMALVAQRERTLSKDELLDRVWPGLVVEENNLQVHISALRKLLGPSAIATIPGRGYQFTALPTQPPAAASTATLPAAGPNNLPHERTRFIGRATALADGARLLRETRLLTLTGIGGCGKTRLALQLARRQVAEFAHGVWFVDLAPLREPGQVAETMARTLDVREETGKPALQRLAEQLAGRRHLIVLDNCEQVLGAVAEVAEVLLGACAGLSLVATSRERIGVAGEQVFPVQPLSLPRAADGAAMQDSEAVQLFVDRATQARPDFGLDERNRDAIGEVCRRLDGVALAIELAAARVDMLSVQEIAGRLDDRFRFLAGGCRALPRHQTLLATLQWSHESLGVPAQRLFRELSVFAGGCTLGAAAQVAQAGDELQTIELMTQLHDKSLLVVEQSDAAAPRYRMLETVRHYAQDRLLEAGDGNSVRGRHLGFFVALAEEAGQRIHGPAQGRWLACLRSEQQNLLAAHAWCEHAPGGGLANLQLVASLWRYWVASAQLERGHALARAALANSAVAADQPLRCRALFALGQIAFRIGRYDETLQAAERCLFLARAIDAPEHIAAGLILRAGGLLATGQIALALPQFEAACQTARPLGHSFALIAGLHGLAEVHRALGHLEAAEARYEEAIATARALGDARAAALPLCNLAGLQVAMGRGSKARRLLLESLALAAASGQRGMGEHLLGVSAALAASVGEHRFAARFCGAAQACMHEAGSRREPLHEAFIAPLVARARAALGSGSFEAEKACGEALSHAAALAEVEAWLEAGG